MTPTWQGVYPAATTQFKEDLTIDLPASQRVIDNLVKDGVHGIIAMGTCGENNSLDPGEKQTLLRCGDRSRRGARRSVVTGVFRIRSAPRGRPSPKRRRRRAPTV